MQGEGDDTGQSGQEDQAHRIGDPGQQNIKQRQGEVGTVERAERVA